MLKLSRIRPLMDESGPIYIAATKIIALYRGSGSTSVHTGANTFEVEETPEQIMAMPQMSLVTLPVNIATVTGPHPFNTNSTNR